MSLPVASQPVRVTLTPSPFTLKHGGQHLRGVAFEGFEALDGGCVESWAHPGTAPTDSGAVQSQQPQEDCERVDEFNMPELS